MLFAEVSPKTNDLETMDQPITVFINTKNEGTNDGNQLYLKKSADQDDEQFDGSGVGYPTELYYGIGNNDEISCSPSAGDCVYQDFAYLSSRRDRIGGRNSVRDVKQDDYEQAKVINAAATLSSLSPFKATCSKCWEQKIKHNDPDDFAIMIGEGQQPVKITSDVLRAMLSAMDHLPKDSQAHQKVDAQSTPACSACRPSQLATGDVENKEKPSEDGSKHGKRENNHADCGNDSGSSKKKRKTWFWPFF